MGLYLLIADVNKCKNASLFSAYNDYSHMSPRADSSPCEILLTNPVEVINRRH
jgi:hypothetical protein